MDVLKERLVTGGTSRTIKKTLIVPRKVFPTGVVVALHKLIANLATGNGASSRTATIHWHAPRKMTGNSVKLIIVKIRKKAFASCEQIDT